MALIDLHVDPNAAVRDLTISQRQMIEIARALSVNAKLIIMDEPNSSLSGTETERLFAVIETLKARDIAIIYVSHKIDEVLRISDRITRLARWPLRGHRRPQGRHRAARRQHDGRP